MTDRKHAHDAPPASNVAQPLGWQPMDALHEEFDALLAIANGEGDKDWPELLSRIDEHLRLHFAEEDRWMHETDFPPRDCHVDEHAAVLKSSAEVLQLAREGDTTHAPSFVAELARWFPGHADYLDSALATWLCKRQFGGRPVVLHRRKDTAAL